ncbi:uncharacterized protein BJ212DRAFT_1294993 [Suillus subaureus]|uniref:Uncharacterized protein n=1 Tax=Suillus subaureus TaxID=48587 RepID=A0A9P7EMC8_9AGAM|nr:uncharacterized protein BJ212DRAFT_1294993 [Suillus subaureus]KAG1825586.1 hypothetical protein BJ212DRAFT_1294993 [Suillus subaureus]
MGKAMVDEMVMAEVFADVECNLGEIGGDNGVDESMSDTSDEQRNNSCEHWTHVQVEARNTTLQIIGLLGIFFHSMGVPQKVIDVLAHVGLSISITSIHNAVHLMSKEIAANIKQGIQSLKVSFAYDNFDINFKTSEPTIGHHLTFVSTIPRHYAAQQHYGLLILITLHRQQQLLKSMSSTCYNITSMTLTVGPNKTFLSNMAGILDHLWTNLESQNQSYRYLSQRWIKYLSIP